MLKLYGAMISRAHRVVWMLKELGVPYEHIETHFLDGSTHQPAYLEVNPNGRVPAIDDDGVRMCESMAINLYLARKFRSPLSPEGVVEEGLATQWSFWVVTEIEKPLLLCAANRFLFAEASRNGDEAAMALARLARPFKVLDAHLAGGAHLLGERFTVADLNVAAVMTLIPLAAIDIAAWPHMQAWLAQCLERPAAADWKSVRFTIPRPATALGMLKLFI